MIHRNLAKVLEFPKGAKRLLFWVNANECRKREVDANGRNADQFR